MDTTTILATINNLTAAIAETTMTTEELKAISESVDNLKKQLTESKKAAKKAEKAEQTAYLGMSVADKNSTAEGLYVVWLKSDNTVCFGKTLKQKAESKTLAVEASAEFVKDGGKKSRYLKLNQSAEQHVSKCAIIDEEFFNELLATESNKTRLAIVKEYFTAE